MKKILFSIFAAGVLSLTSCTLETSNNWRLDGYWHLERVDTISTGGFLDLSEKRLFWAVQVNLLQVIDRDYKNGSYIFHFDYTKKETSLNLYDPRIYDKVQGDPKIEDVELLKPYGINSLEENFEIVNLTGSGLVLVSGDLQLSFIQF